MKKFKLFLCTLLVSVLVFSTTVYAYDPLRDRNYQRLGNDFVFIEVGDAQQIDVDMFIYVVGNTPREMVDLYNQEDVRVYLTKTVANQERVLNGSLYDGVCYGATFTYDNSSKKITSVTSSVEIYIYSNTFRADTYYHECGHALNYLAEYITGYYQGPKPISSSAEWQTLYSQNAAIMSSFDSNANANVPRNASEGFAEAYRLYFVYPDLLRAYCPGVYSFVQGQISKYLSYVKPVTYETFDYEAYYRLYPDVAAAVGLDRKALWDHYVNYGKAEGRACPRKH